MFLSMLIALPIFFLRLKLHSERVEKIKPWIFFTLSIPSLADLLGSSFQQMGLVYVPVSVYQMLKGSIVIFSAVFSGIFLKRKFLKVQVVGLGVCFFALVLVGLSSVLNTGKTTLETSGEDQENTLETSGEDQKLHSKNTFFRWFFGVFYIIFGQVLCSVQYIFEEYFLKPPMDVDPMALVGIEGTIFPTRFECISWCFPLIIEHIFTYSPLISSIFLRLLHSF